MKRNQQFLKTIFVSSALALSAFSVNAQTELFVDDAGTGDGTSWDNAASQDIIAAINAAPGTDDLTVYVAEGTYSAPTLSATIGSTLPNRNVTILGGYPDGLTGTETCGYDPVNNKTIIDGTGGQSESLFRIDSGDQNLKIKGFEFPSPDSETSTYGNILTILGKTGGTYVLQDIYVGQILDANGTDGVGGLVHVAGNASGNTITVENVVVKDIDGPGAIHVTGVSSNNLVQVINSTFTNSLTDATTRGGGAIGIDGGNDSANPNKLDVDNSTFCSNKASNRDGGAIGLIEGAEAQVNNCYFNGNDSQGGESGGAISVKGGSVLVSTNNVYDANLAGAEGGALFIEDSKLTSTGDIFMNHDTEDVNDGGAIAVFNNASDGDSTEDVIIDNAKFYNNKVSGNGGAIWTDNNVGKNLKVTNSEFLQNTSDDGGAIYSQADIYIDNCKFSSNTADNKIGGGLGGAIYSGNSGAYIANSCFDGNKSSDGGAALFVADNKNTTRYFDVPSGVTTSSSALQVRHVFYNNSVTGNEVGYDIGITGDDGVVGGAVVYQDVRSSAGPDEREGNIIVNGSKFYNNVLWYNGDDVASGLTFRIGTSNTGDGDNVVAFQNNAFAGNTRGRSNYGNDNTQSATVTKVDVALSDYDEAAIFLTDNTKFQLASNATNYPPLQNPSALDWEGIEQTSATYGNTDTSDAMDCTLTAPTTDKTCPTLTAIVPENVTPEACVPDYGDLDTADGYDSLGALAYPSTTTEPNVPYYKDAVWAGTLITTESTYNGNGDASSDATGDDGLAVDTKAPSTGTGRTGIWTVTMNSNKPTEVFYELRIDWDLDGTFEDKYTGSIMTASPASEDVTINIPDGFDLTKTANIRLVAATSAADAATTSGTFTNGEVEDFQYAASEILPVTLLTFDAEQSGNDVALTWSTASEQHNDKFIVEYSLDGIDFQTFTEVEGAGTTSEKQDYTATHVGIATTGVPTVYYRLSQVDFDGQTSYAGDIQRVDFATVTKLTAFPVPTEKGQAVTVQGLTSIGNYTIYNSTGQLEASGNEKGNTLLISTSGLGSGVYFVQFENGKVAKFIVK